MEPTVCSLDQLPVVKGGTVWWSMIRGVNFCIARLAVVEKIGRWEEASDCLNPAGNTVDWVLGGWITFIPSGT